MTLIETQKTQTTINAGERIPPMTFTVDVATFNSGAIVAVIDDDGTGQGEHNECEEGNNTAEWTEAVCEE